MQQCGLIQLRGLLHARVYLGEGETVAGKGVATPRALANLASL